MNLKEKIKKSISETLNKKYEEFKKVKKEEKKTK